MNTAAQPCLLFLASWTGSSPFSMQLRAYIFHGRKPGRPRHSSSPWLAGCAFRREYDTDWPCLSSQHGASPVTCAGPTRQKSNVTFRLSSQRLRATLATVHSAWRRNGHGTVFLLVSVTSAPSLTVFNSQLKTFLFDNSFFVTIYLIN